MIENDIRCLIFFTVYQKVLKGSQRSAYLTERKAMMVHRLQGCMFNTNSDFQFQSLFFILFIVLSHKVICSMNYVDLNLYFIDTGLVMLKWRSILPIMQCCCLVYCDVLYYVFISFIFLILKLQINILKNKKRRYH